jgi:hypothetical protein
MQDNYSLNSTTSCLKSLTHSDPLSPKCTGKSVITIGQDAGIKGYKIGIDGSKVDWLSVFIALIGIGGDISLLSTAVGNFLGPEAWGLSELVEIGGFVKDGLDTANAISDKDMPNAFLSGLGAITDLAALPPEVGIPLTYYL